MLQGQDRKRSKIKSILRINRKTKAKAAGECESGEVKEKKATDRTGVCMDKRGSTIPEIYNQGIRRCKGTMVNDLHGDQLKKDA